MRKFMNKKLGDPNGQLKPYSVTQVVRAGFAESVKKVLPCAHGRTGECDECNELIAKCARCQPNRKGLYPCDSCAVLTPDKQPQAGVLCGRCGRGASSECVDGAGHAFEAGATCCHEHCDGDEQQHMTVCLECYEYLAGAEQDTERRRHVHAQELLAVSRAFERKAWGDAALLVRGIAEMADGLTRDVLRAVSAQLATLAEVDGETRKEHLDRAQARLNGAGVCHA